MYGLCYLSEELVTQSGRRMHIVELFVGTGALTSYLMGLKRPIVPSTGLSSPAARTIIRKLGLEKPTEITFVDSGPWAHTWHALTSSDDSAEHVATVLEKWLESGSEYTENCRKLIATYNCDEQTYAAAFLATQAKDASKLPTAIRRLAALDWPLVRTIGGSGHAVAAVGDICHIDLEYASGEPFLDITKAIDKWIKAGARVLITGKEKIAQLIKDDWLTIELSRDKWALVSPP